MVEIHLERTIAAPVEQVFDWLADPANLAAAPLVLKAGYAKGSSEPGAGAVREVTGRGHLVPRRHHGLRAAAQLLYLIVRSFPPFNHDGGTLTFTRSGDRTHVDWLTNYTHPARAGGKLLEVVSRPVLRSSFLAILDACAKALER